jgi:hypothetical protein
LGYGIYHEQSERDSCRSVFGNDRIAVNYWPLTSFNDIHVMDKLPLLGCKFLEFDFLVCGTILNDLHRPFDQDACASMINIKLII